MNSLYKFNVNEGIKSFQSIYRYNKTSRVRYWLYGVLIFGALFLFIPWTQNISANGSVTTLRQEQRPQQLNTVIPGKVIKWYVKEGDHVRAGDTIIKLAETKDDYLDPDLLQRMREQINAKMGSLKNYEQKALMAQSQNEALRQSIRLKRAELDNKIQQQKMKILSDSAELMAAINDLKIKSLQYQRQLLMYDSGLVSLTQLEQRNQATQDALAKKNSAEVKYNNAKQEFLRLQIEQNNIQQDYNEKIAKVEGERFQTLSQIATGEGEVAKLENQYMNYNIRKDLYFIISPQDGQVVKAKKAGIGEIVKEGELIIEIVPKEVQFAVELFVKPVDLPLLAIGQQVRFTFDGFPAIVFSGWPDASYGIFNGKIVAVENAVSDNGKFRVLVAEDSSYKPWPATLRIGAGAKGFALLKDVPVWYELWRNINGFPPDYYIQSEGKVDKANKK